MRRLVLAAALLVTAAPVTAALPARADAPAVVASIKPVHSLVAAVMRGVGEPGLIVRGAASPHTYSMKPSDARLLEGAGVVFWIGPEMEGFLAKPLAANAGRARTLALMEAPGLTLLETREGGAWEKHEHHHGDDDDHHDDDHHDGHEHHDDHADHDDGHHDGHAEHDGHLWLDPANAKAMVSAIAATLAEADPAHAAAYRANAAAAAAGLDALDAEIAATLAPVADRPFVVFHDAYHYLEHRYHLNAVGAITVSPERRPSAQRLTEIRAKIAGLAAACVFAEPQFEPALVDTLIEGTAARKGVLDPEGATMSEGPELYATLMRTNARALAGCLGR